MCVCVCVGGGGGGVYFAYREGRARGIITLHKLSQLCIIFVMHLLICVYLIKLLQHTRGTLVIHVWRCVVILFSSFKFIY